ncbi:hypothetical protein AJ80_00873 [Polytolypa hystricis UAMH7299]|uniref:VPS37 C-terminal domain-containing protein n=1 Tax=Polytolypa hystricis (strain UAMH7299) TaxID=1447883 RepID=A0A2B7Z1C8_POLH7|nr:hypothetical protein AJ80_00873 [Polytolypa hystricis UAMH7299]
MTLNRDTPPPPPPKPSSHEASRGGTPLQLGSGGGGTPGQAGFQPPLMVAGEGGLGQGPQGGLGGAYEREQLGHGAGGETGALDARGHQQQQQQQQQVQPPAIEDGWIPDILKDKSTTDLQSLLSQNPPLLSALSTLHPSYPSSLPHLTSSLETNKSLATHLLDLHTRLTALRTATSTLLLQHQSLELSWRKKQAEMDAALEPWSPKALYQRLVAGIAEQEAVCRAVEESFLEDDGGGAGAGGAGAGGDGGSRKAGEREVSEWVKRVRGEGARLEMRREERARWDEGRVGGWR